MDLNKRENAGYNKKSYFEQMNNVLGHHSLDQLVEEDTWCRVVNGNKISSRIDHVYTTRSNAINELKQYQNAYSDHQMIVLTITKRNSKS